MVMNPPSSANRISLVAPRQERPALPPALRRWVLGRDGYRCQAPGCGRRENLEVHHVANRMDPDPAGGRNHPANLVTVCALCHPLWDLMGRGPFLAESARAREIPFNQAVGQ